MRPLIQMPETLHVMRSELSQVICSKSDWSVSDYWKLPAVHLNRENVFSWVQRSSSKDNNNKWNAIWYDVMSVILTLQSAGKKCLLKKKREISWGFSAYFQQLKNPHDVCVDSVSHSVYVGELDPSMVWKLSRTEATPSKPHHIDHHDQPSKPTNGASIGMKTSIFLAVHKMFK